MSCASSKDETENCSELSKKLLMDNQNYVRLDSNRTLNQILENYVIENPSNHNSNSIIILLIIGSFMMIFIIVLLILVFILNRKIQGLKATLKELMKESPGVTLSQQNEQHEDSNGYEVPIPFEENVYQTVDYSQKVNIQEGNQ